MVWQDDERETIETLERRCLHCHHMELFHDFHCCPSCKVIGCKCEDWDDSGFPKK